MAGVVCNKCGFLNPPGAIFCQQCGELLPLAADAGDEALGPTMPDYQPGPTMPDSPPGLDGETVEMEAPPMDLTRPAAGAGIPPIGEETIVAQPAPTQIARGYPRSAQPPTSSLWRTPWPYLIILLALLAVVLCGMAIFVVTSEPTALSGLIPGFGGPTQTPVVAVLTPAMSEPTSEPPTGPTSAPQTPADTPPYMVIPTSTPLGGAPPEGPATAPPSGPTPTYTFTPPPTLTPSPTTAPAASLTPTPFSCPGAPEPRLEVGGRGRVTFTSGLPVRIRATPGLGGAFVANMAEGTEFDVIGGPECADGFVWWQVRTPTGITGWSAEGDPGEYYLEPWP